MSVPLLESLLPPGPARTPAEHLAAVRLRERAPADRPFVLANFVASVDGHATVAGSSRALGGPGDLELLLALRAFADAVLLGTSTVAAEGYARLVGAEHRRAARVAAGLAADPLAVLVTRSGRVPWAAGLFAAPEQPVLVYGPAEPPPDLAAPVEVVRSPAAAGGRAGGETAAPVEVVPAAAGGVPAGETGAPVGNAAAPNLRAVLADLRARGVRALLSEAGPTLTRALLGEGLVDELFLTVSPLLTADTTQPGILAGPGAAGAGPARAALGPAPRGRALPALRRIPGA